MDLIDAHPLASPLAPMRERTPGPQVAPAGDETRKAALETPWLVFDDRWIAANGIGRVAAEWAAHGLGWRRIGRGPRPVSPTDPLWLALRLRDETLPFLSPGFNAPAATRRPFFLTVHDLCYVDLAAITGRLRQVYFRTVVRDRCLAAAGVLTVSEFSARRLVDAFGLDPARVHVVRPGVSPVFAPNGVAARFERPYVLCVSNPSPHKNEPRTVAAFLSSSLPRTHDLVFTGPPRDVGLAVGEATVRFVGRVDDVHLAELYRGASALAFASLYEGFGLPALEAMACGTPVVCAGSTGLASTVADAALKVDPYSVTDIARGLERVVHDRDLAGHLREAGGARAREFDWIRCTRDVERAVRGAVEADGR
jgi:glycosyltransferase involved in cell wall biosynthesis